MEGGKGSFSPIHSSNPPICHIPFLGRMEGTRNLPTFHPIPSSNLPSSVTHLTFHSSNLPTASSSILPSFQLTVFFSSAPSPSLSYSRFRNRTRNRLNSSPCGADVHQANFRDRKYKRRFRSTQIQYAFQSVVVSIRRQRWSLVHVH